ncbi:MAG: hypothetical protein WC222_11375 [Parachlamydiales bacterium]|jgi:hypothetical protein
MNIKTTVNQLNSGATIHIYDSTLDYNVTTNPGGWCLDALGPNPQRTDIDELIITVAKGDLTVTLNYTGADITSYLDPTHGLLLSAATMFGTAYDVFEDGIYAITITMNGSWTNPDTGLVEDVAESDEIYEALLWAMNDDIRHLVITIEVPIKNYLEAYNTSLLNTLFDAIIYNCEYGNIEKAQDIIDYLTDVLANNTTLTELFKNFENYG